MSELNGLTPKKWIELYERGEWKQKVLSTCHAVATCEHADPRDREVALAFWGTLLTEGHVVEAPIDGDFRPFPVVVRDTHLSILRGRNGALDKDLRQDMRERLEGVKQVVFAVTQFHKVDQLGSGDDEVAIPFAVNSATAN